MRRPGARVRATGAVVAMAVAASLLAGCSSSTITVTATFDDVGDMVVDHSVQLADVRIGRVSGIQLTEDYRALVTMEIDAGVRVPQNTVPVVSKTSLLGEKYVDLRPRGEPTEGPFLQDGDDLGRGLEAPELEFVAQQAIGLLGAVVANDVATLVDTGATAFGGRRDDLRRIIDNLAVMSRTFADHAGDIGAIVDGLDRATGELARGSGQLEALLGNLAETTEVLAANRNRAIAALDQLSRLAAVQNDLLERFRSDMDRQIKQVDAILAEVAAASGELGAVVDWLDEFVTRLPLGIPGDFTQIYMWAVPVQQDPRSPEGGGS